MENTALLKQKREIIQQTPPPFANANGAKKVLVINGHPDRESFNWALAEAYRSGLAESEAVVEQINIADLQFNPNLAYGYRVISPLEPDLLMAIEKIKAADHMVWVFPSWWHGLPALMKGFVDRTFLPGLFFKFEQGKLFPKQLLKGKTARLIITADTVRWYDRWFMKSPAIQQFKKGTLQFVGIDPVKVTYIAPVKNSTEAFRAKWLRKVGQMGQKAS